jgi:hypothetical protein
MGFVLILPPSQNHDAIKIIISGIPQKRNFEWQARRQFCDCSVCVQGRSHCQGPKLEGKEEKNEKKEKQERRKCHLERGTLHTARVKCICHEFIKNYDNQSYFEEAKCLRAQSIYFMLEQRRQQLRICTN